jgi:PAS domain S-box-containing protein
MDQRSFNRLLRRIYLLPFVAMLLLTSLLLWQINQLVQAIRWVEHTDKITSDARYLMRAVLDMETGMRGYLLTGDEKFLDPYHVSEPNVATTFDEVERLLDDDVQKQRLSTMRRVFESWRAYSAQMIALRQHGGDYRSVEANVEGKQIMDEFRRERDTFLQNEESKRAQRVERVQHQTVVVFTSGALLSILLGSLLALFLKRQVLAVSATYNSAIAAAENNAEQLRENNEFITTVLGSIAEGVIATDKEGQIAFMNRVAETSTGWRWQDALGKPLEEIFNVGDQDGHSLEGTLLARVAATRKALPLGSDTYLLRGSGAVPIEANAAPIIARDTTMLGIVLVFRDITQRQQSENALRNSERLAALGRLASSMAHEINNPLDSLANLLYLLEHQGGLDAAGQEQLKLAGEELERITQIARNMLGFHRMVAQPVPVQLTDIVETVLVLYSGRLRAGGLEAEKRFDVPGVVLAQPVEMRQIFANLIANAIDASPVGGRVLVHVRTGCDWRDSSNTGVRVFVADCGCGIEQAARTRIMEPFFTTKGQRGNGLGLWVTRGIIEKYGGSLRFRSSTDPARHGTVFSVFLPSGIAGRDRAPRKFRIPLAS